MYSQNDSSNAQGLTKTKRYLFGLGDFCFTFFINFVGYYLMFYLTDVIKFPSVLAATLYTLVQGFEVATVLISGVIVDQCRMKAGKFRPWLIIGGIICAVGTVLFFTRFNFTIKVYTLMFPLFYLIAYWGYNIMWVGYRSLLGKVAVNHKDTTSVSVACTQMSVVASLIFSVTGVKILYGFSDITAGYTVSAALYGLIIIVCMAVIFKITKKDDVYKTDAGASPERKRVTLKETLKCLTGPMVPFFISIVLRNSVNVAVPALMVYYFNYVLNYSGGMSLYITFVTAAQVIAVLVINLFIKRFSKKTLYIASSFLSVAALSAAYFFGDSVIPFIVCMAVNNFSLIFSATFTNAFITDIADYNEYVLGLKARGFTVSIGATANRLASLIGGAIASFGLAAIGYSGGAAVQPESMAQSIKLLVTLGSAGFSFLGLIPFLFYKLTDKTMKEVDELKSKANENAALNGQSL